jgi:hypothetical protein
LAGGNTAGQRFYFGAAGRFQAIEINGEDVDNPATQPASKIPPWLRQSYYFT